MSGEPAVTVESPQVGDLSQTLFFCPECGMPAWVEWADEVPSTSGTVELGKVRCIQRHWFLMPLSGLERAELR
jgi:hypothetical protein